MSHPQTIATPQWQPLNCPIADSPRSPVVLWHDHNCGKLVGQSEGKDHHDGVRIYCHVGADLPVYCLIALIRDESTVLAAISWATDGKVFTLTTMHLLIEHTLIRGYRVR